MRDLDKTILDLGRYKGGRGSNKRKHREDDANTTTSSWRGVDLESTMYDNRLLAGYLAHEFVTKGTVFGKQYDPARAETLPVQSGAKLRRSEDSRRFEFEAEANKGKPKKVDSQSYAEVASLFQREGTHIPGIINPTELARWIQL